MEWQRGESTFSCIQQDLGFVVDYPLCVCVCVCVAALLLSKVWYTKSHLLAMQKVWWWTLRS